MQATECEAAFELGASRHHDLRIAAPGRGQGGQPPGSGDAVTVDEGQKVAAGDGGADVASFAARTGQAPNDERKFPLEPLRDVNRGVTAFCIHQDDLEQVFLADQRRQQGCDVRLFVARGHDDTDTHAANLRRLRRSSRRSSRSTTRSAT